jgi:hypothetical protein
LKEGIMPKIYKTKIKASDGDIYIIHSKKPFKQCDTSDIIMLEFVNTHDKTGWSFDFTALEVLLEESVEYKRGGKRADL